MAERYEDMSKGDGGTQTTSLAPRALGDSDVVTLASCLPSLFQSSKFPARIRMLHSPEIVVSSCQRRRDTVEHRARAALV
jgi:hypothetical protein